MHFNRLALKEKNAMEDQGIQRFNQVKITFSLRIKHTYYDRFYSYFELKSLYCLFSNVISLEPKDETDPSETWSSLREALDREHAMDELEELAQFDPHVVHDENYFNRIQNSEKHKNDKRGYNPLKVENLVDIPLSVLDQDTDPTDPLFQHQWYLKNTGQNGGKPKLDLNVQQAWAQGVTGKNITTAIMDDGVDYMHPDLIRNYVSSYFVFK